MRLGEIEQLANGVITLADIYTALHEADDGSNDEVHQTIIAEETMLTIYNDVSEKNNDNQDICIAFTVASVHKLPIDEDDGFSLLYVL